MARMALEISVILISYEKFYIGNFQSEFLGDFFAVGISNPNFFGIIWLLEFQIRIYHVLFFCGNFKYNFLMGNFFVGIAAVVSFKFSIIFSDIT